MYILISQDEDLRGLIPRIVDSIFSALLEKVSYKLFHLIESKKQIHDAAAVLSV